MPKGPNMIHFVCICGEPFDVPAEMAGESIQCQACRRLVDVPRLGEVDDFAADGTVRLADAEEASSDYEGKVRAFGQREDMRSSLDEFLTAGTGDPATTPRSRPTPRYDPITGELMLPVGIRNDELPPPPPPMDPGAPVLGYARSTAQAADGSGESITWWSMPWRLASGWSLMAIGIVWAVHAVMATGLIVPGFNVFFIFIVLILTLIIIAHYCNTIEDFGPNDRDRVPVLLRGVSLSEDVVNPLWSFGIALAYAFAPLLLSLMFVPGDVLREHRVIVYSTTAWGMLIFPAALFTIICGGVIQNLMPKRVVSVVTVAPVKYLLASLTFYIALFVYDFALSGVTFMPTSALALSATKGQLMRELLDLSLTLAIFAAAVYLMHLAAAWLGLIYRGNLNALDWVLQRHERVNRTDAMAVLMNRRTGNRPKPDPERLRHVRESDAARAAGARPVLPALPASDTPRRHSGFEVKLYKP
ncbi:MAG TPA: hypothetical protein VF595_04455 [Tepidisphaeraceae bacterium]|jgi:hypothetical protein